MLSRLELQSKVQITEDLLQVEGSSKTPSKKRGPGTYNKACDECHRRLICSLVLLLKIFHCFIIIAYRRGKCDGTRPFCEKCQSSGREVRLYNSSQVLA